MNGKIKSDTIIENICAIFFVISVMLVSFAPYQSDSTLSLHSNTFSSVTRVLLYGLVFINFILIVSSYLRTKKIDKANILQVVPLLLFFIITSFYSYNGIINFKGLLNLLQCITFVLSSKTIKLKTFKYFKKVIFVVCLLGIICFINYYLELFIPFQLVKYYQQNTYSRYVDYKIIFLLTNQYTNSLRLCGVFNEPGYLGTICALLLCAFDVDLKDKENIIIFIAGLLTFSLAFIIIILAYLLLKYVKNIKTIIITVAILFLFLFVIPNIETSNSSLGRVIDRMKITEDGLSGDNRSGEDLDRILENMLIYKPFFGYGDGYLNTQKLEAHSTYKSYVIEYGIIGCLLIWGSLFVASLYKKMGNINILFYVLVFFLSIYQRPHIFVFIYQIILYGGILYVESNAQINKKLILKSKKFDSFKIEK